MNSHRFRPSLRASVGLLVATVTTQGLLGFHFASILFYRTGAYFLDAGFYVYSVASPRAPRTPPLVSAIWGDSVFKTHTTVSPMLIMGFLRVFIDTPINFIVYLGLQHALLSLAAAAVVGTSFRLFGSSVRRSVLAGTLAGALLPFSNIGMGSLVYPHVEVLGASCITIGFVLLAVRWTWNGSRWLTITAVTLMVIGALTREDLGGHLAITAAAGVLCAPRRSIDRHGRRRAALLVGGGAGMTLAFLMFQRVVMGSTGSFRISYSGSPPYAHITSVWYLLQTTLGLLGSRLDLVLALATFVMASIVFRRRELLAFPAAALPWLLLNVTSVDPSKKVLGIYLMFPMIIYMAAPILALTVGNRPGTVDTREQTDVIDHERGRIPVMSYVFGVAALFLGGISAPPNGFGYAYYSMIRYRPVGLGEMRLANRIARDFAASRLNVAVDDAVMSLEPVALEDIPLITGVEDSASLDAILFYPAYGLGENRVVEVMDAWAGANRRISLECLPAGLVRANAGAPELVGEQQTGRGQFNRALKCHPRPSM